MQIKNAEVILKTRINAGVHYLVKGLNIHGITPKFFKERITKPHNGTRQRKIRRT